MGAVLVLALLAAGCAASDDSSKDAESTPSTAAPSNVGKVPAGFEAYYTQTLDWSTCGGDYECATATAPMDWSDPDSDPIELALKRLPTAGKRVGSLFFNPGGPGGSGVNLIEYVAPSFEGKVADAYDIVTWDPRGVGASDAVTCLDDEAKDELYAATYNDDEEGRAAALADNQKWVDACTQNTGELLQYVDTQSSARDLDMLRAVVGDRTLSYIGFSYGSQLGSVYAGIFPANVGRMVLDGAVDMKVSPEDQSVQQIQAFERALRAYVEDCLAGTSCPLSGSTDEAMAQIKSLFDAVGQAALPTEDTDRPLTVALARIGVISALYDESTWTYLTLALDEAMNDGEGNILALLADAYLERESDGHYSNMHDAHAAISCLDGPRVEDMAALNQRRAEVAPTLADSEGAVLEDCQDWPYPVVEAKFDVNAAGAAPIVVLGTTGDPATPYEWAQAQAETLESGVLVTLEGEGHTGYMQANECLKNAVDDYFVDGTVPADGLTC